MPKHQARQALTPRPQIHPVCWHTECFNSFRDQLIGLDPAGPLRTPHCISNWPIHEGRRRKSAACSSLLTVLAVKRPLETEKREATDGAFTCCEEGLPGVR